MGVLNMPPPPATNRGDSQEPATPVRVLNHRRTRSALRAPLVINFLSDVGCEYYFENLCSHHLW